MSEQRPNPGSRGISEAMLRARMANEMEDLRGTLYAAIRERDEARAEVERMRLSDDLTRAALGSWVFVPPDGGAEPTHERVAAVVAEVDRLTRERDEARGEVEKLRDVGEQAMRVLVKAFNRIHPEPRTSDTELARAIEIITGKIRSALVRATPEAKP